MKKVYYDAGNRIRYLRERQHYTREQLAEMADISPKFLYEIESGQESGCRGAESTEKDNTTESAG